MNSAIRPYWSLGGPLVEIGDRVSFGGTPGTVSRIADRKRGPKIVIEWDDKKFPPSGRYFWPSDLSRIERIS